MFVCLEDLLIPEKNSSLFLCEPCKSPTFPDTDSRFVVEIAFVHKRKLHIFLLSPLNLVSKDLSHFDNILARKLEPCFLDSFDCSLECRDRYPSSTANLDLFCGQIGRTILGLHSMIVGFSKPLNFLIIFGTCLIGFHAKPLMQFFWGLFSMFP